MMIKASKVSNFFLSYAREHGDYLTNLKLQKLLYYAQAWHLALFNEPLFEDDLQAWVHGPVVASEYKRFKNFSWNPITANLSVHKLDEDTIKFLKEVFQKYARFSALELERMTHEELPWQTARGSTPPDKNSNTVLSIDQIKDFFGAKLRRAKKRKA